MVIKNVFKIILLYVLFVNAGCTEEKEPFKLDADFSQSLIITGSNYRDQQLVGTVNELRIYKTIGTKLDMYSLSELRNKELIFSTKDKSYIRIIILKSREYTMHVPKCYENKGKISFHVLLYDHINKKVGYFLLIPCKVDGKEYGIIHNLQKGEGGCIYYNTSLLNILRELNIYKQP